ncbi:uncharacterized protein LOC111635450 [Centruroides sculpturatus]|uniref:uncharacterized protein LOC111635450 n=1 Tax=Centruroides sculpturatus TaxID=218467 RepID=UPI000C6D583C|nr:uncharacterized protein LOC111635450 [Centruroides sculpturatus]
MMTKLLQIWEIFDEMNEKWKMLLPLIYVHFTIDCCFYTYVGLFVQIDKVVRVYCLCIGAVLSSLTLSAAWALSIFTSVVYDNLITIGKFYSYLKSLEYIFKIISFMKRFGGRPFGISMAGFFYVKKNFLIRMLHCLYSILSLLIEVTGVMQKNKCLLKSSKSVALTNETVF